MSNQDRLEVCKLCGKQVATSAQTCTNCGADLSLQRLGALSIFRKRQLSGALYKLKIEVDGVQKGELGLGESMDFDLPHGVYSVHVAFRPFSLTSATKQVFVRGGGKIHLVASVGFWGLQLDED